MLADILQANDNLQIRKSVQINHSLITCATAYQIALGNAIQSKCVLILIANYDTELPAVQCCRESHVKNV